MPLCSFTTQRCYILTFIFLVNDIPINTSAPVFFPSPVMYAVFGPRISQSGALIICKNISANQISVVPGQMRAAYLRAHREKGAVIDQLI